MSYKTNTYFLAIILIFCGILSSGFADVESWKIQSVEFSGNESFRSGQLLNRMVTRKTTWFYPAKFSTQLFQQDLKNLVQFYSNQGFLNAAIMSHQIEQDSSNKKVNIHIYINEGMRFSIESIEFLGNQHFSDSLLQNYIQLKPGKALNINNVTKKATSILRLYGNYGYLDASVDPNIKQVPSKNKVVIEYQIKEGRPYKMGDLKILGNKKTKSGLFYRDFSLKKSDSLSYNALNRTQRKLYLTGVFNQVQVEPDTFSQDSFYRDVLIRVNEKKSVDCFIALGFGTLDRLRAKFELAEINLGGMARKLALTSKVSFIYRGIQTSYSEPRLFNTHWKTDLNLLTFYKKEPGYKLYQWGGKIQFGHHIKQLVQFSASYQILMGELNDVKVESLPSDIKTNVKNLKLSLIRDRRDNVFNPKWGYFIETSCELGSAFADEVEQFIRLKGQVKYFFPLTQKIILGSSLRGGWINAREGIVNIPLQERFYAGGPNSVRGYAYQKLGPKDQSGHPTGGKFMIVWNLMEIRFPFYRWIDWAAFVDVGQVWDHMKDISMDDLIYTPGFGPRINTPIGTIRLDLGLNPKPEKHENPLKIHFQIGNSF